MKLYILLLGLGGGGGGVEKLRLKLSQLPTKLKLKLKLKLGLAIMGLKEPLLLSVTIIENLINIFLKNNLKFYKNVLTAITPRGVFSTLC